jgi:excisionase family DNA binding protein
MMSTKLEEAVIQPVVLSIRQAGTYLNVSSDTVRRLIRGGSIPHARVGNSIRIRRADLEDYLQGQISQTWQPVDNRGGGFRGHGAR